MVPRDMKNRNQWKYVENDVKDDGMYVREVSKCCDAGRGKFKYRSLLILDKESHKDARCHLTYLRYILTI